jgi:hypothetical protein
VRLPRRPSIVLLTLISLIGLSGIALAEHEDAKEDTTFSFGYDEENHVLAVNTAPNDGLYVCEFENGVLTAQYGDSSEAGVIPVDSLEDEEGVKEFNPRLQHELAEGLVEATDPYAYAGADGECKVNGIVVAGPNGQVNHGQFMKAFKSLIEVKGHGCLNRYLAQSDLGKTESTKLQTSDVDPEFEVGDSGELQFLTFEADCVHGKEDKATEEGAEARGNSKVKKDKSQKGKSENAPGKNK